MKKLLMVCALLVVCIVANPAYAAPLPPKTIVAPAQSWSGCYAGAHVGGAWSHLDITDVGVLGHAAAANGVAGQVFNANSSSVLRGGHVGCDVRAGAIIVGPVFDLGWMGLNKSTLDPGSASNTIAGIDSGLYGDISERIGVPVHKKALLYGKGGWAFFNGRRLYSTQSANIISVSNVGVFSGFVVGGGVEYRLRSNWTGNAEYSYYGFPSQTFDTLNTSANAYPFKEKLSVNVLKLGVNYRFGRKR